MQRRKFSREYKLEAVKLVRERGVGVAQAARDLDVHENVLRKWIKEYGVDPVQAFPGHGHMKPEQVEIDRLRKADDYFAEIKPVKVAPEQLKLAENMIESQMKPWGPSMAEDPVQDRLLDIIEAKKKAHKTTTPKKGAAPAGDQKPSNVINKLQGQHRLWRSGASTALVWPSSRPMIAKLAHWLTVVPAAFLTDT